MSAMQHNAPELLVPAGSPEKLKVAVMYGADAVYLGGQRFGLRAMAENFTDTELERAVRFADRQGVKVYVTLNAFLHDEDLDGLGAYAKKLAEMGVAAGIVSDLGVATVIQESSSLPIHLSTQASCLSTAAARFWKRLGVTRVIVGRELTIAESGRIAREADMEVEMFIHGAMCMAYSGNCTISNFTAGRDSNRGGCIQSCRFNYAHTAVPSFTAASLAVVQENSGGSCASSGYFMSSRDQMGVRLVPEFIKHGICSLKIEGRMKSVFYAATLCSAYRRIIDACLDGSITEAMYVAAEREMQSVPHREYFSGSMEQRAGLNSIYEHDGDSATRGTHQYLGLVVDADSERIALRLARPLVAGSQIEFIDRMRGSIRWEVADLESITGDAIREANQETVVTIPRAAGLEAIHPFTVARVAA